MIGFTNVLIEGSQDLGRDILYLSPQLTIIDNLGPQIIITLLDFAFSILMLFEVVYNESICFFVEFEAELSDELGGSKFG